MLQSLPALSGSGRFAQAGDEGVATELQFPGDEALGLKGVFGDVL